MKKDHVLCKGTSSFKISERMRGLMCLLGQSVVFEEASEIFKEILDVEISAPQIQRICVHYGELLDPLIESNCEAVIPKLETNKKGDPAYVMVDGSMLFTRDDKWRELKLGLIFYDSQVVDIQLNRRKICKSIYVSHLGNVDEFFPKFERFLVPYKNKVILGDGAKWIWNWAEDNYPGSIQILDFFHAKEKIVLFAKHQFLDDEKRISWILKQKEKLLNNQVEQVISIIKKCRSRNDEAQTAKRKTIAYFVDHEDRMQYKTYKEKGLMIGSGPVEAAHRSVIQQRMKLSGQKWSLRGAQAMANLRCYKHSGAWAVIKRIIAAAA